MDSLQEYARQRRAELQYLMALPPQGLLQLAGDEIENRWARAPALKTVREAEHSGRGVEAALRLAYETLIELDAGVDEEGMRMLVALEKRLSKRGRRANPPLSEHMAHDDLDEIASLLAGRFVSKGEFSSGAAFRKFVYDLANNVAQVAEAAAIDAEDDTVACDAFATVSEAANEVSVAVRKMMSPYQPKRRY